jgi:threonine/homoserine/homoserine lactone efflux protein
MHLAAFLAVAALVIVAPGPDMALVARNALRDGRGHAVATGVGVFAGLVVWTVAASAGLAAVLRASQAAFLALKLAGGCYLAYLGLRTLYDAYRGRASEPSAHGRTGRSPGWRRSLRQGLLSNLGNPKIAVFFTSFLPQFVSGGRAPFSALLALGLLFSALTLAWLTGYAAAVARAGDLLRRPRVKRAVDGLTGAVLLGLGVRLALERRG